MYNHSYMPSRQDFFGQLWKEYALSDSRYMSVDPLVLCMESWTVVCTSFAVSFILLIRLAYVGTSVLSNSTAHHNRLALSPFNASTGVNWPHLRESSVLFDKSFRGFQQWQEVLSS